MNVIDSDFKDFKGNELGNYCDRSHAFFWGEGGVMSMHEKKINVSVNEIESCTSIAQSKYWEEGFF